MSLLNPYDLNVGIANAASSSTTADSTNVQNISVDKSNPFATNVSNIGNSIGNVTKDVGGAIAGSQAGTQGTTTALGIGQHPESTASAKANTAAVNAAASTDTQAVNAAQSSAAAAGPVSATQKASIAQNATAISEDEQQLTAYKNNPTAFAQNNPTIVQAAAAAGMTVQDYLNADLQKNQAALSSTTAAIQSAQAANIAISSASAPVTAAQIQAEQNAATANQAVQNKASEAGGWGGAFASGVVAAAQQTANQGNMATAKAQDTYNTAANAFQAVNNQLENEMNQHTVDANTAMQQMNTSLAAISTQLATNQSSDSQQLKAKADAAAQALQNLQNEYAQGNMGMSEFWSVFGTILQTVGAVAAVAA